MPTPPVRISLHKIFVLFALSLSLTACASEESNVTPAPRSDYVEGEVLVGLKADTTALRAAVAQELLPGSREMERIVIGGQSVGHRALKSGANTEPTPPLEVVRLQLPEGMSVEAAVAELSNRSDLLYAEPNYKIHRAVVPNDAFFPKQWGLHNIGGTTFSGKWGTFTGPGPDIGAPAAWEVSTGDSSVIVATIDSGIEYDHPDLKDNIWLNKNDPIGDSNNDGFPGIAGVDDDGDGLIDEDSLNRSRFLPDGVTPNPYWKNDLINDDDENGYIDDWHGWNFVANNNNPKDDDVFSSYDRRPLGHGSHVAGIIGASGNNSIGVSGVNWKVKLMPLKFLSSTGDGDVANAAKAINYAIAAEGVRIINASYEYSGPASQTELAAINTARTAGLLLIAAAGNSGVNIDNGSKVYPASHPLDNIISVAASDPSDNKASFSNYGVTSVDLFAPGVYIYSTVRLDRDIKQIENPYYDYMSGTSMAAPMVSGAAALVWAKYPELSASEVREVLLATVKNIPSLDAQVASGGRLDLSQSLTVDIHPPTPSAPLNLKTEGHTGGAILSWDDATEDETAVIIERSLNNLPFTEIARLKKNTTSYLDNINRDGVMVSYRLKNLAILSPSSYSYSADLLIPLNAPAELHSYADIEGIHLIWNDKSSDEAGFKIERREEGGTTFTEIANLPANSTEYIDTDVVTGGRYLYRIRTYNPLDDSDFSNELPAQISGESAGSGRSSSPCFIATAAFGTPFMPEVAALRTFRDRVLMTNPTGRAFVALYYRTSPPLADFIATHDFLRAGVRALLRPLVWLVKVITPKDATAMSPRPEQPPVMEEDPEVIAGELLVCFRPEQSREAIARILQAEKSVELEALPSPQGKVLRIRLPAGVTTSIAQQHFSAYKEVVYAEPNRRVRIRKQ